MNKKTNKWKIIATQEKFIELYKKQRAVNQEGAKKMLGILAEKKQRHKLRGEEYIVPEEWLE